MYPMNTTAAYNAHHDKRIRFEHHFAPEDYVLIKQLPPTNSSAGRLAWMSMESASKDDWDYTVSSA